MSLRSPACLTEACKTISQTMWIHQLEDSWTSRADLGPAYSWLYPWHLVLLMPQFPHLYNCVGKASLQSPFIALNEKHINAKCCCNEKYFPGLFRISGKSILDTAPGMLLQWHFYSKSAFHQKYKGLKGESRSRLVVQDQSVTQCYCS